MGGPGKDRRSGPRRQRSIRILARTPLAWATISRASLAACQRTNRRHPIPRIRPAAGRNDAILGAPPVRLRARPPILMPASTSFSGSSSSAAARARSSRCASDSAIKRSRRRRSDSAARLTGASPAVRSPYAIPRRSPQGAEPDGTRGVAASRRRSASAQSTVRSPPRAPRADACPRTRRRSIT